MKIEHNLYKHAILFIISKNFPDNRKHFGTIYDYITDRFYKMEIELSMGELFSSSNINFIGYVMDESIITFTCINSENQQVF